MASVISAKPPPEVAPTAVVDPSAAMREFFRILKPGGLLFVEVPYFSSVHFFTDPTHVHAFTTRSFDYYVDGTAVSKFGYSPARFVKERVEIVARSLR